MATSKTKPLSRKRISEDEEEEYHHVTRRNKKMLKTVSIESLPDDAVFDILLRVPAQDLHNAARFVCRKWFQTIGTRAFILAHLQHSSHGLLIQECFETVTLLLVAAQKGGHITEISDFENRGEVFSSSNGLLLERHYDNMTDDVRITNPMTKQHFHLPSFDYVTGYHNSALAYAVASGVYKVVRTFFSKSGKQECAILTVGVDADWERCVDVQHLSPEALLLLRHNCPLTTEGGFVHWAQNGGRYYSEYVLTLDVENEIISEFRVPPDFGRRELLYRFLPMGSHLSLLTARRADKFPTWDEVWVMKPETGEWTKVMSIDSESQKCAFKWVAYNCTSYPVGWLKFLEVLVFRAYCDSSTGFCIAYNIRTHEIESFGLDFTPNKFIVHKASLLC